MRTKKSIDHHCCFLARQNKGKRRKKDGVEITVHSLSRWVREHCKLSSTADQRLIFLNDLYFVLFLKIAVLV